jgi:hypothetical protein
VNNRTYLLCTLALSALPVSSAAPRIDFDRQIRPLFSDKCFTCHGPDEKQRQAGLRFDTKQGAARVITPGDSAHSRLLQRIGAANKANRMPPPASGLALTDQQIDLIRQWVDQGAVWETHWAYVAPIRPDLPAVQHKNWARNSIDSFVLAKLEKEGLPPAPEAGKATLLRRVSYDLTGLPPTPAEVDSFEADKSPNAYEKRVDALLASPRYGERMAMQWLDLARYADTHGYHIDSHREMWPWRNWVIDAFNHNMPFDRFTVEQLAGDLLPNPTREQKIATGFNRNHMINFEGGAIPEEYQTEYVVDRVEATTTVWMGMTMGCARCHDHKYDPIKQKEFYQFFAFFNAIPEKGLDGRTGNAQPVLPLPTPAQQQQLDAVKHEIANRQQALPEKEVAARQAEWEMTRLATLPPAPRDGLTAHYEMEGHLADTSGFYRHAKAVRGEVTYADGVVGRAAVFSGETEVQFGTPSAQTAAFSLAAWVKAGTKTAVTVLQKLDTSGSGFHLALDESAVIPDLKRGSHIEFSLIRHAPDDSIRIRTRERFTQGSWFHVAVSCDGSAKAAGLRIYVDGKQREVETVRDNLSGPVTPAPAALEVGAKRFGNPYKGQVDDLRLYSRPLAPAEIDQLAMEAPVRATLSADAAKRSKEQAARLREYFLTHDAPEAMRVAHADLERLEAQKTRLEKLIPTVMVMEQMEKPRDTFVLGRGDYRNHLDKVTPTLPSWLPPLPEGAPLNRLGLAEWLVSPSHPLTARVAVNRYWQMYFGTGLVKTTEDFGSQGEAPSHPELLDWLATEFMRSGWDVKAMQRLIVTSAAYRQDSRITPELIERDPENRLLARGPRFRLQAEMIRDNALAISGLLNERIGGPSVFPYQPKGLWEETAYGDVYSAQSYTPGSGADLYRRSMYTFWKRTSPPPSLNTFDAPDREKCTARRARTNTPLQALVLLNDPTYVEASRALAQRMLTEGGHDPAARINFAFRLATARKPVPRERQVLRDIAERELSVYHKDPAAALKLLHVGESKFDRNLDPGELAAWTTVASVILNLDETITKQ